MRSAENVEQPKQRSAFVLALIGHDIIDEVVADPSSTLGVPEGSCKLPFGVVGRLMGVMSKATKWVILATSSGNE